MWGIGWKEMSHMDIECHMEQTGRHRWKSRSMRTSQLCFSGAMAMSRRVRWPYLLARRGTTDLQQQPRLLLDISCAWEWCTSGLSMSALMQQREVQQRRTCFGWENGRQKGKNSQLHISRSPWKWESILHFSSILVFVSLPAQAADACRIS